MHLRAEWALAFLTHCPKHLRSLTISCRNCCCSGSYAFTAAASNLVCARCGHLIPLHFFTGNCKASTVAVVLLQAQMLRTVRGLPPDTLWLGAISAERFLSTINDILRLQTHRENGEGSILANTLGPCEFSSYQPLTRGIEHPPLCTLLARLRLTLIAALAQFLLGPRRAAYFKSAQNVRASEKLCYPLNRMALAADEWEFLETMLPFWPFYLRERLSGALGLMGTRRPQAKAA